MISIFRELNQFKIHIQTTNSVNIINERPDSNTHSILLYDYRTVVRHTNQLNDFENELTRVAPSSKTFWNNGSLKSVTVLWRQAQCILSLTYQPGANTQAASANWCFRPKRSQIFGRLFLASLAVERWSGSSLEIIYFARWESCAPVLCLATRAPIELWVLVITSLWCAERWFN